MVRYYMRKHIENVVYYGNLFTVEWYFDSKGAMPALTYFKGLTNKRQDKLLYLIKRIGDYGIINNKQLFRNEGDGIYTFKPKPDRFLCFFFKERKVIVTNGFEKRQDKLPKSEKKKALEMKQDYEIKVKEGKYYE